MLWLADNFITAISGLTSLAALQQLNLACNDISAIGSSLAANTALTCLNLAANSVSRFEVCQLRRLQQQAAWSRAVDVHAATQAR